MVTKDQALKLALEALEFDGFTPEDATHRLLTVKATAKCKEALAHPWPDLTEQQREAYQKGHNDGVAHHKQAIKAAQPEREREPVMGTKTWFEDGKVVTQHLTAKDIYKEPEQEPVADGLIRQYFNSLVANKPDEAANATKAMVDYVYTTPPKRELVGRAEQGENTKQRVLQLIKELRPAIRPMEALGKPMTTQEWFDVLVKNIEVMI